jgi:hypothetical protein
MAMTPQQEAEYALDYGVDPASLSSAAQAEYDRLKSTRDAQQNGYGQQGGYGAQGGYGQQNGYGPQGGYAQQNAYGQ